MRRRRQPGAWAVLGVLATCICLPSSAGAYPDPMVVAGDTALTLDPSLVIRGGSPRYLLFTTQNQTRASADRTVFVNGGPTFVPFPAEWTHPYSGGNSIWAPDVSYHDGKYWMYYCASTAGSPGRLSAIGVATSPTGESGTWTDRGMVIDSGPGDGHNYNALDPNLMVDASGRWWLTFGSHWDGLHVVELDPDTGKLKAGARPLNVAKRSAANPLIEAGFQFRQGGYYYLFASFDNCCGTAPITYNVRVGRSSSPTGPFVDRDGVDMLSGGGTMVLESHDHVRGPGGQSVVHDPWDDSDLLVYHWYDQRLNNTQFLGINHLGWDAAGWPYVY